MCTLTLYVCQPSSEIDIKKQNGKKRKKGWKRGREATDVHPLCRNRRKPRRNRINYLFINRPNRIPFQQHLILTGSLGKHERLQRLDSHTPSPHPPERREPRVVPSAGETELEAVAELALGEKGVHKVDTAEVPDVYFAEVEGGEHPLVLGVAVPVFVGTEGVGDAFM